MQMSEAQVKKTITYPGNLHISQLGLSLLITRLKGNYAKEPAPAVLSQCTNEINNFFVKFGAIMQKDYDMLSKL